MKKITLLLLLSLSILGVQAQTTYQLNYDSIRVNKTAGTGANSLYGKVYLKNVSSGLSSDSILVVRNGRIFKQASAVLVTGNQSVAGNKTFTGNSILAGTVLIGSATPIANGGSGSQSPIEIAGTTGGTGIMIADNNSASNAEVYIAGNLANNVGATGKSGVIAFRKGSDVSSTSGFYGLEVHATKNIAGVNYDRFGWSFYADQGMAVFPPTYEPSYAPGNKIHKIYGYTAATSYGVGTGGTDSIEVHDNSSDQTKLIPASYYLTPTGSGSGLSGVVLTTTDQTIGGNKIFSNDLTVNSLVIGKGSGNQLYNTVIGTGSSVNNTTGNFNTTIGFNSLANNISGNYQTAIGLSAGRYTNAGANNETSTYSVYLGTDSRASADGNNNEIVIGYVALGNGSNSVTIGNDAITKTVLKGQLKLNSTITNGTYTYTLPSATGTLALTSDLSSYLPLTGGTLTGNIERLANSTGTADYYARNINANGYTRYVLGTDLGAGRGVIGMLGSGLGEKMYMGSEANIPTTIQTNGTDRITVSGSGTVTVASLGTGTVYSNSGVLTNTNPSDSTLKNTIKPLGYGLSEILKLKPKTFYYNSDSTKSNLKYGFIAQEVKTIMPEIVRTISKDSDKLGLESDGIYVTLVKAIQEQQAIIADLKKRLEILENK